MAGFLSFALAASFSGDLLPESADIVQPAERENLAATTIQPLEPQSVGPTPPPIPSAAPTPVQGHVTHNPFDLLNLQADSGELGARKTGFTARSVSKAPTVVAKVAAPVAAQPPPTPAPPTAPPLPFTVLGGITGDRIAGGRPVAFLRMRDEVLTVQAGDEIDKTYRVEAITGDSVELTYLPLKERQSLIMRP